MDRKGEKRKQSQSARPDKALANLAVKPGQTIFHSYPLPQEKHRDRLQLWDMSLVRSCWGPGLCFMFMCTCLEWECDCVCQGVCLAKACAKANFLFMRFSLLHRWLNLKCTIWRRKRKRRKRKRQRKRQRRQRQRRSRLRSSYPYHVAYVLTPVTLVGTRASQAPPSTPLQLVIANLAHLGQLPMCSGVWDLTEGDDDAGGHTSEHVLCHMPTAEHACACVPMS